MRRNLQRLMVALAAMMICLGASAADKVVKKVTLTGEVTSLEDLKSSTFFLVDGEGDNSVVLYIPSGWDFKVGKTSILAGDAGQGAYFKLDADGDNFQLPVFNIDGTQRTVPGWAGGDGFAYLNSQPSTGNVIFGLAGKNSQKGQDGANLAVWTVSYTEGSGFAFKCVGRTDADVYVGYDGGNARPIITSETVPVPYWKAYTGFDAGYDAAEVQAAVQAVATSLKTTDAKAAYEGAKGAYEADPEAAGALDAYVAALNAAIDVINACESVNNQFASYKLTSAGKAAVKDVQTKYNAGEYKDAAELNAALVAAVKAQNCDGADMTGAIINPSFETGNLNGWTNSGSISTQAQGNMAFDNVKGAFYCERWHVDGTIDLNQTITNLPAGEYELSAYVYSEPADATIYANGQSTDVTASASGLYTVQATVDESGELKIGTTVTLTGSTWFCVDDFKLTLVKAANPTIPEKDAWYTGDDFFRFRAFKTLDDTTSPYYAYSNAKVEPQWGAAAGEETNGCIVCKVPANADPKSQLWIRGTEAGKAIANGSKEGFKVTFRVKADGEYKGLESQAHNGWGYKTGGSPFGTLDVTTEWQTVSFICTGEKAKGDFTDLCFNLSGDTERTFYFDDVQIERGSEWYLNNEFHAKDYYKENEEDPDPVYSDSDNPHPLARFVADAEGGYVEVVTNAARNNPWDSQIWIGIPSEYVGKITKMTMQVWADESVTCSESYHATATGKGWGASVSPGTGLVTEADKWVDITRILNTKNVMCNGVYTNKQVDYYCLDLSNDAQNTGDGVVYRFRNIKFDKAAEDWYTNNEITVDGAKALYIYGDGEEGGYVEVAGGKSLVFGIPANLQGGDVKISMKVKAAAEDATTDIIYTTEWADASIIVEAAEATYTLALPAEGTFDFDEVAFEKYYKPIDYGELIGIPVEGTLVKEVDFTTATSWTHSPSWAQNKEGYTDKLIIGEGLEIVNNADQGMWESQFFILENAPLVADKDYAVRYTLKYDGEGGDMQINLQAGDWSTNNQAVYPLAAGPIYTQMVHIAKGWTGNGNANVFFQSGAIKGRMIVEKVEVFDITPKYDEMAWTDNILVNGDLEGEDMNEFVGKIVKGDYIYDGEGLPTDEYVYEDLDPETLLLEAEEYVEGWDQEQAGEAGPNGLVISVAEWPEGTGNDYDSQFFLRLPKALPKGTVFKLEFDYAGSNAAVSSVIAAHAEPGKWQANFTKSIKPADEWAWTHFEEFLTAPEDMRAIAINLGSKNGGVYLFDNFSVKVDEAKAADIEELTADWDLNWAETLALNEKIHEAKGYDNEEGQYTEESFSALQTAITDAKTVAKNAEAAKDDIVAATSDVQDAIDGLKAPKTLLPAPETDPDYADFEEITQDQGITLDGNPRAVVTDCGTYTNYSASEDLSVAFKITNIDVEGCDYVTVKFATAIPDGWVIAFGKLDDLTTEAIPAGSSEFKKQLADVSSIQDDVLPQITILTLWGAQKPLELDVYGVYKHKVAPELSYTDLTQDMFFQWTDWTDADPVANAGCAYDVNVESGQPYGDSNVINYADLSEYATLEVTTPAGTAVQPRFLFNRDVNEGQDNEVEENAHLIDMPKFAWSEKYQSVKENVDGSKTYVIDIAAIVADKGYAHLHAIKALGWGNSTTVTDMKLGYYGEKPSIPIPTAINAVAEGGEGAALKDGKYFVDGQTIIVKNGKKYTVAGVEIK